MSRFVRSCKNCVVSYICEKSQKSQGWQFFESQWRKLQKIAKSDEFSRWLRFYKCIINIIDERPKNIIDTIALCKSQNIRM